MNPSPQDLDELFALDRAEAEHMGDADLDRLRSAMHEIPAEQGWRSRLQGLSTSARTSIASLAYLVVAGTLVLVAGPRRDLSGNLDLRGVLILPVLAVLGSLGLSVALRSYDRPPLPAWQRRAWQALVLVPPVLAAIPGLWPGSTLPQEAIAALHMPCFATGLLVAVPVVLLAILLDRGDRMPAWRIAVASAAGGLAAFVSLQLHCGAANPVHLIVAHGSEGALLAVTGLAVAWMRRRSP